MKRSMLATDERDRGDGELDIRYGKIGISAVAAALRYQSEAKNPAYAPSVTDATARAAEAA